MSHAFSSLALSPLHEWAPREVSPMSPVNRLHTNKSFTSWYEDDKLFHNISHISWYSSRCLMHEWESKGRVSIKEGGQQEVNTKSTQSLHKVNKKSIQSLHKRSPLAKFTQLWTKSYHTVNAIPISTRITPTYTILDIAYIYAYCIYITATRIENQGDW